MRCLLPKSLLAHGFFQVNTQQKERDDKITAGQVCNYSWSGQRKIPSYVNKLVFPDDFLTVLRTIAMTEDQLFQVSSLLQQVRVLFPPYSFPFVLGINGLKLTQRSACQSSSQATVLMLASQDPTAIITLVEIFK